MKLEVQFLPIQKELHSFLGYESRQESPKTASESTIKKL
jgi:hypothetical protein